MASASIPVVLITGANQGIGFYIAQLLSQSKIPYTILVGARNPARGTDAVAKLNETKSNSQSSIAFLEIDINSHESISKAVDKVTSDHGRLDILVNNAAISGGTTPEIENWKEVFETNVIGTVDATHSFLPLLQKSSDAKLVVISSSIGSITMCEAAPPHPLLNLPSPYRCSKAAINMAIVQWAKMLNNVKVWGVDPGLCATDFAGDYSRSKGRDPKEGADIARQCIEGEREDSLGKVVWEQNGETGVRPW